jgi:hypothetical protein
MESFVSDFVLFFIGAILLLVTLKLLFGKNNVAGQPYKYVLLMEVTKLYISFERPCGLCHVGLD